MLRFVQSPEFKYLQTFWGTFKSPERLSSEECDATSHIIIHLLHTCSHLHANSRNNKGDQLFIGHICARVSYAHTHTYRQTKKSIKDVDVLNLLHD